MSSGVYSKHREQYGQGAERGTSLEEQTEDQSKEMCWNQGQRTGQEPGHAEKAQRFL